MLFCDIHCHLLPGLDDGAFFSDESCRMAELAVRHGSGYIVCTPHFYPDRQYNTETLKQTFRDTAACIRDEGIGLRLFLGQEIYFGEDYQNTLFLLKTGKLLTVNNSIYPLIEFDPMMPLDDVMFILRAIVSLGLVPIIAHPERYAFVAEDSEVLFRIRNTGALLQLNRGSIQGYFGRAAMQVADFMLRERIADFVASDAHSPYRRTPILDEFHQWLSEEISMTYADFLLSINPLRVIKNETATHYR